MPRFASSSLTIASHLRFPEDHCPLSAPGHCGQLASPGTGRALANTSLLATLKNELATYGRSLTYWSSRPPSSDRPLCPTIASVYSDKVQLGSSAALVRLQSYPIA